MSNLKPKLWLLLLMSMFFVGAAHAKKPNVMLILVDDMGYSDLGCYGGEIKTPAIDGLASNGVRYAQYYNCARCWSTRAALMCGYYPHQVNRDNVLDISGGGGGHKRPAWATLVPEYLKSAGIAPITPENGMTVNRPRAVSINPFISQIQIVSSVLKNCISMITSRLQ